MLSSLRLLFVFLALSLSACSTYTPLKDRDLRKPVGHAPTAGKPAVKVTFLGNSTLHIDDGKTSLLVDGFVSRPSRFKTAFGKIEPDQTIIKDELRKAGIRHVDAVLVGHAHHDHALDATAIADRYGADVVGSRSFGWIYTGSHQPGGSGNLVVVPKKGAEYKYGKFKVTFALSDHVGSHLAPQRKIEGQITSPVAMPAGYSDFKCGDVFALYIAHPEGNIVVTTTAGAKPEQLKDKKADVVFLGVGFLSKESPAKQDAYWRETVEATNPKVVVPVHWDDFTRKLSKGLKPFSPTVENSKTLMGLVKHKAGERPVRVLDLRESVSLQHGEVYIAEAPAAPR